MLTALLAGVALGQAPSVNSGGVVSGASFGPGQPVAPGSIVSIFGTNLAAGIAQASSIPLSTSMSVVDVASVTFNNVAAPLFYASPSQINAELPWEVASSGTANIVVTRGTGVSAPVAVQVGLLTPGIFTTTLTGKGQAAALIFPDNAIAAPAGSIPGALTRPAVPGDVLTIYCTGLGPVNPPAQTGNNSLDTLRTTTNQPTVLIGGVQAQVNFSGLAPQFVALYQINAVVPPGVPPGNTVPVQIMIGGTTSNDQVTIAVGSK